MTVFADAMGCRGEGGSGTHFVPLLPQRATRGVARTAAGGLMFVLLGAAALNAAEDDSDPTPVDRSISIARLSIKMKSFEHVPDQELEEALANTKAAGDSKERMAAVLAGEASLYAAGKLQGQERIDFLERATRGGDAAAAAALGDMLDTGDGLEEDAERAAAYYRAGALGGRMDAAHDLGVDYAKGRGLQRDFSEALAWLMVARKRGDSTGEDQRLRNYLAARKHDDLIASGEKRAHELEGKKRVEEIVAALPPVAPLTFTRRETEVETVDAREFSEKKGEAPAAAPPLVVMTILGDRLTWPSLAHLERAANHEEPVALAALGRLLAAGKGLPADPLRAVVLLERSAAMGNIDAAHQLGDLYSKGEGIVRDDAKAFSYFMQAARGGSLLAMANVGVYCTNGRGTERDVVSGLAWLVVAKGFGVDLGQEARLRGFLEKNRPDDVAKAEALAAKLKKEVEARVPGHG